MTTKIIKKYKNRRLYDVEQSQYITFKALKDYVLRGIDFKVIDSNTDEDLTTNTLLQLFMEQEAQENNMLSNQILKQLIIYSEHPMHALLRDCISQSFAFFENTVLTQKNQKNNPFSELNKTWLNMSQSMFDAFYNKDKPPSPDKD